MVAVYLSCCLFLHRDVVHPGMHPGYRDARLYTVAAHRYLCENSLTLGHTSCYPGPRTAAQWLSHESLVAAYNGPCVPHAGLPCQTALAAPRWCRSALIPSTPPRQPGADTCVHILPSILRIPSWKTRGLLGSTASAQCTREIKLHCFRHLRESSETVFLHETHWKIKAFARIVYYSDAVADGENFRGG